MPNLIKVRSLAEQVAREIHMPTLSHDMRQGTPSISYQLWKLGSNIR